MIDFSSAILQYVPTASAYSYEMVEFNPAILQSTAQAITYSNELVVYDPLKLQSSPRGMTYSYDNVNDPATSPSALKIWDGTQWVAKPYYEWDGTKWVQIS
jgi:hypothetical protein